MRKIGFVGEAWGRHEARARRAFVGDAGRELWHWSPVPRDDALVTNLCNFQPPGNRDPKPAEIKAEWPRLTREIQEAGPEILVLLGKLPTTAFLGRPVAMDLVHGRPQEATPGEPLRDLLRGRGTILLPCYHPAAIMHATRLYGAFIEDMHVLGTLRDGTYQPPCPQKETHYATSGMGDLRVLCRTGDLVAVDTEYTPDGRPICLTYSAVPGEGYLVYA